jgi:hypothetical protein
MSKRGKETAIEQHHGMEELFATAWVSTSKFYALPL